MNILFISDDFFGYAKEIRANLQSRGHDVLWFPDRHATDSWSKFMIRVAPRLVRSRADAHLQRILAGCRDRRIDQVLVIKGEGLSPPMIAKLKAELPGAHFTIYFWDSYLNMPRDSADKVSLFDASFTFDPKDAAADSRLRYRPLFYLDEYANLPQGNDGIDVLFFGTIHTDRYSVLCRLLDALPTGLKTQRVMYFASKWIFRIRSIADPSFWRSKKSDFVFVPLNKPAVMKLISRARIVVDIERPVQSGLTMRTLEMLGAGRKLITTNPQVRTADFYSPQNICVIDRHRPRVDGDFVRSEYVPPPSNLLRKYSLTGWIDEVLPALR